LDSLPSRRHTTQLPIFESQGFVHTPNFSPAMAALSTYSNLSLGLTPLNPFENSFYSPTDDTLGNLVNSPINSLMSNTALEKIEEMKGEEDEGGALWHIFKREDETALVGYLTEYSALHNIKVSTPENPLASILDHSFYLNETMLEELERKKGVKAYTFVQKLGDAIYIPSGCPHQVKNLRCCMKVAEDFVSAENLMCCVRLTELFRTLPVGHKFHNDKLQVRSILYHSIKRSVEELELKKKE